MKYQIYIFFNSKFDKKLVRYRYILYLNIIEVIDATRVTEKVRNIILRS